MALGLTEAILRRVPRASDASASLGGNRQSAITATSNTNVLVFPADSTAPTTPCWVTFTPSVDCRIRFGRAGIGAAVAADHFWGAGISQEFWWDPNEDTNFSVIRASTATTDGTLDRARSSQ